MRSYAAVLVGSVFALPLGSGPAISAPMRCNAHPQSPAGGQVQVITGVLETLRVPRLNGPDVGWDPPGTDPSIELAIGYWGSSLEQFGPPSGGHIRAHLREATQSGLSFEITSSHGEHWTLSGSDIEYGSDEAGGPAADIMLDRNSPAGKQVLNAVTRGDELTIVVRRHGATIATSTFRTADVGARNALLARAAAMIRSHNPAACTDKPPPVHVIGG